MRELAHTALILDLDRIATEQAAPDPYSHERTRNVVCAKRKTLCPQHHYPPLPKKRKDRAPGSAQDNARSVFFGIALGCSSGGVSFDG